ncbi:MAG: HAD family phosphatase [Flavobacteriaceae bacterium]|nr:HAD family phosphatase [Flavobacteriaceae bacterium]
MKNNKVCSIIFDLGGVLIDWNPDYVFLDVFKGNVHKMNWFYKNICTVNWNENQDAGYPISRATEEKVIEFPEYEKLIRMYYDRWDEMLKDPIPGTLDILKKLVLSKKYKIYALTNWSSETFPKALKKFEFLKWFDGIIVSGEEKTRKPYRKIYEITINRFNLEPNKTLFIDDNISNIEAAKKLFINSIHFKSPKQLIKDLKNMSIL